MVTKISTTFCCEGQRSLGDIFSLFQYITLISVSDPKTKICFALSATATKISVHFLFSSSKVIDWLTHIFFTIKLLLGWVISKYCMFGYLCDDYRDKHPIHVFKAKGHPLTYIPFFHNITLIRATSGHRQTTSGHWLTTSSDSLTPKKQQQQTRQYYFYEHLILWTP